LIIKPTVFYLKNYYNIKYEKEHNIVLSTDFKHFNGFISWGIKHMQNQIFIQINDLVSTIENYFKIDNLDLFDDLNLFSKGAHQLFNTYIVPQNNNDIFVSKGVIKLSFRALIFQLKDNKISLPDNPLFKKQIKRYIEELLLWLRLIRICDFISRTNPNYNSMVDFKAIKHTHDGFYLSINQESLSTTSLNKMIMLLNRANKFYLETIFGSKAIVMLEKFFTEINEKEKKIIL